VAHHLVAITFFCRVVSSTSSKAQAIYFARKKDKFPHLSGYQKSMNQSNIHLQFRTKSLKSNDVDFQHVESSENCM